MNHQLIEDEGHDNPMDLEQLEQRMLAWLGRSYRATLFQLGAETVGYALHRDDGSGGHELRQFFIGRPHRRKGHGRAAMALLQQEVLRRGARVRLEVLTGNAGAQRFYAALGFVERATTLELTTPEALVGAYHYLQFSPRIATSGVVAPAGFARIAAAGYSAVINLLPADNEFAVADEAQRVMELGMDYIDIPVDFERPSETDFDEFCEALEENPKAKVWVHCAANFRVSCFTALYACKYLGWSPRQAGQLVHQVWQPDRAWQAFLMRLGGAELVARCMGR